jgi:hypothetical protein
MISAGTWTYDSTKSVGYRENTPDSISKGALDCDYFYLRALVKNFDRCGGPFYRKNLARQARRAMGIAFVDSPPEHYARIRSLAWPHLSAFYRFAYTLGELYPSLIRVLMKAKRRIVMGPQSIQS